MNATPRADTATPTGSVRKKTGKGVLWAFLAVVIAFAAGFLISLLDGAALESACRRGNGWSRSRA